MPSILHEAVVELLRNRPSLVPDLLAGMVELPVYEQVHLESTDCTVVTPTEYRADGVVVLRDAAGPVLAVVVEVQLRRDPGKRLTWPVYVATLRARWECPTVLLVVCVEASVARWCAQPIEIGPGWRGEPLVLGPDRVPLLTDLERAAEAPEMAVLSVLAHGAGPEHPGIIDVLVEALSYAEVGRAVSYTGLVLASLPEAARRYMEALMSTETYPYQGEYSRGLVDRGRAEGRTEGRTEGKADSVVAVLEARGLTVTDGDRARIVECSDPERLDVWIRRAVTAGATAELFD